MSGPSGPDRGHLATEAANPRSAGLERLDAAAAVDLMVSEDRAAVAAVDGAREDLAALIELTSTRLAAGGRLIYVGAGTSGRLAVLDASECPPTFGVDPGLVRAIIAGGERALRNAVEGAEEEATDPELENPDEFVDDLDVAAQAEAERDAAAAARAVAGEVARARAAEAAASSDRLEWVGEWADYGIK